MKQYNINYYDVVENMSADITKYLTKGHYTVRQIDSRQAWILSVYDDNCVVIAEILQSYCTLVAAIDYTKNKIYCSGYYSNTTARHISRFAELIYGSYVYSDFKKVMK